MIRVQDVIALALPSGTKVVAGAAGLGREVTWATRPRPTPPAFGHLSGGELVILSPAVLAQLDERLTLDGAVRQLAGSGVSAVAYSGTATKAARDAADAVDLPLLQLPKTAELGPLERDASRLITDRRREVQRRGQDVGRQLMELAIAGEPLDRTVRALAELAKRSVVLQGRDGRVLAFHAPATSSPDLERIGPSLDASHAELARWLVATAVSSPAEPPTVTYDLGPRLVRIIAPVIGRNGLLGSLSLIAPQRGETPEDALFTSRGAAACAVVLARDHAAASARREVELHVLDEILDGALRSETTLLQQAKRLGHNLLAPHVAIVARVDQVGPVRVAGRDGRWSALGDVLKRAGPGREARALWRVRNNSAEIVWPATGGVEVSHLVTSLHSDLAAVTTGEGEISLGVGMVREGLAGIRQSHHEARQALTLGRRLHGPGRVTRFDELGVYRVIFAAEGLPEVGSFHDETLGGLIDHDRLNNADLQRTLNAYFAARCSPKEAASLLGVHRNTVLYRLERIREITGQDLDDATVRLQLQLALHIHQALYGGAE